MTDGPITFTGLIKFLQYIKGPDHWHYVGETGEPAFENSWVNYGAARPVRFIKDATGVVHINGFVKDGSGDIFSLPVGYRPSYAIVASSQGNSGVGRFDVQLDGDVEYLTGGNTWFTVNISFYVG